MHLSGPARVALRVVTAVVLAFVYLPLLVVVINSFNPARVRRTLWLTAVIAISWPMIRLCSSPSMLSSFAVSSSVSL